MRLIFLAASMLITVFGAYAAEIPKNSPAQAEEVYADSIYWRDWYSPPPDWRAGVPIGQYTVNTRIPDLIWVSYEGAYAQGLRIRPVAKEMLEKQIEAKLIDAKRNPTPFEFSAKLEKQAQHRTVSIAKLDKDASNVVAVSFKMKATGKKAGTNLRFNTGLGLIDTEKHENREAKCSGGFREYRIPVKANANSRIRDISIIVDEMEGADSEQEYIIFDLVYHHSKKFPYVKDIPPRKWAVDDGEKDIGGVYSYMNSKTTDPGVEVVDLPLNGWAPRDAEKDKNIKVEPVSVTVGGKQLAGVRFTVTKGERAYWNCPVNIDPTKFNTMSFLYKIELPDGVTPLIGTLRPPDFAWHAALYHQYFDNFGVSYYSDRHDVNDWTGYGVSRTSAAWQQQKESITVGWKVFAWDNLNDDMTGNKDFSRDAVSHWSFFYDSKKIPDGKQVVITILNPKAASGIMHTGGDMKKYREFKKEFAKLKYDYSDSSKCLEPPLKGHLAAPLELMKNGIFTGEIVIASNDEVLHTAANELQNLIQLICGPVNEVPVLNKPTEKDNVKIFLGGHAWKQCKALAEEQKKALQDDFIKLKDGQGAAIRTIGKNIFIFGGDFEYTPGSRYPGTGRGTLIGVYQFIENNTDMIQGSYPISVKWVMSRTIPDFVFTRPKDGNWSVVWGDAVVQPALKAFSVTGHGDTRNKAVNGQSIDNWNYDREDMKYGFLRQKAVNHWFGYGALDPKDTKKPNEKWGLGPDGKRMVPGCYTGHPCLINVLEDGKMDYISSVLPEYREMPGKRLYQVTDMVALWVEDTQKLCVCEKCTAPIRLPGGELVNCDETDFRSTQFYAQTNAMIQAYNVYVNPNQQIEPIAYFWQFVIPRCPISRMYRVKIAPYTRKNYKEPVYAPINDMFWRNYNRWEQLGNNYAQYEYFLGIGFRPWCDVNAFDIRAEMAMGVNTMIFEGSGTKADRMEYWVLCRQLMFPDADPMQLRKYYIRRTYREAAPDMEKFYFKLHASYYSDPLRVEFEDSDQRMAYWASWTKSADGKTLADELTGHLDDALKNVRHPVAKLYIDELRNEWLAYLEKAKASLEKAGLKNEKK